MLDNMNETTVESVPTLKSGYMVKYLGLSPSVAKYPKQKK